MDYELFRRREVREDGAEDFVGGDLFHAGVGHGLAQGRVAGAAGDGLVDHADHRALRGVTGGIGRAE